MSCSARLPVYLLLIGAFFPKNAALVLFSIYLIGILLAIIFARIFRKTLFRSADVPFVMELPPYRVPTARTLLKHMWGKGVQYLKKVSGVIFIASIIVWALGYFPRTEEFTEKYEQKRTEAKENYEVALQQTSKTKQNELTANYEEQLQEINNAEQEAILENTFIGRIGKTIEPKNNRACPCPLGF